MCESDERQEIVKKSLQETEREQRLVEGDEEDVNPAYEFTKEDAADSIRHSAGDSGPSNRDVAPLMKDGKTGNDNRSK